ncbi:hypothetical protein [Spirosoma spitsbergense]|uniref:hypothetical protein n=1 Tax=Spirosoma spitsbergense TaxID=431554 RepID=UPI0003724323|nr:hypothetical protein [Spirosoma spitsbergense]
MHITKLLTGCLLLFIFSSCEKDIIPADGPLTGSDRGLRTTACSEFAYTDSTFYLSNKLTNYIVKPTTALAGTYGAKPYGLVIDPATGAINISKSETGLTYTVFYVKTGTTDTCTRNITIAGIDFANSLYVLSQNDTLATPTFKGVAPSMVGTNSLNFDVVTGLANTMTLQSQGISINSKTGSVNLKKTLSSGVLGVKPANGTSVTVRLYYKINDTSQGALNHIDLRFTYYSTVSDVPASLLKKVGVTTTQSSAGARSAADDGGGAKPRPPEIVIVG